MMKKKIAAALLAFVMCIGSVFGVCAQTTATGDVNGDSAVDTLDAILALRISLGFERASQAQLDRADLNGDGVINSSDALNILILTVYSSVEEMVKNRRATPEMYSEPKEGIDVSFWQEDIDFEAVKRSGIDFVIIRAGGATDNPKENHKDIDPRRQGVDAYFERNYAKAKAAGLNVGVYWFSFATNTAEAKKEAQSCLRAIKGKQLEYPVFYDIENEYQFDKGEKFCSSIMKTFCTEIKNGGYYPAFYMSSFYATHYLDDEVKSNYDCWIAQWNGRIDYKSDYTMWQRGVRSVDGVNGDVDDDVSYYNYPDYLRWLGVNGWNY